MQVVKYKAALTEAAMAGDSSRQHIPQPKQDGDAGVVGVPYGDSLPTALRETTTAAKDVVR